MRKLRRSEIELRVAICKAVDDDPTLRYVDLQERFDTSAYTVARALEGDMATWTAMLGKGRAAPGTGAREVPAAEAGEAEHAVVAIRGIASDDGKPSYLLLDEDTGKWEDVPGTTPVDALAGHFNMGFEVVAAIKTERGAGPRVGAWEVWLKRRLRPRGGGKP